MSKLKLKKSVRGLKCILNKLLAQTGRSSKPPTPRSLAEFLLIFIIMAAALTLVGYLFYKNYENQFRAQVESQLTSIAELKVNGLAAWRAERLGDAQVMRHNLAFAALAAHCLENPTDTQAQTQMQAWLDMLRSVYQYDRVFLLDAHGLERFSSPATPEPVAAHLLEELPAVLAAGQVTFLDFHRDTAAGPIYLAVLTPIYAAPDNRPLGLLVLRIDPAEYLYPYLQQWPVPSASAEIALVRREGDDALYLNELRFQNNTALNLRISLEDTERPSVKAVLGQEGVVEGVNYRGVPVIAAMRAVPDSPWFLVARVDAAEIYAPLRERLWQTVILFGALLAAAGAGLGLVWRQQSIVYYREQAALAQSLRELSEQNEAILQTVPDIIAEVDRNKVYTWVNQAGRQFFGEEVIGQEAAFYFEGEQNTYEEVQPLFEGDPSIVYVESWQRRQDGERRLLAWWCRNLKDANGNVTGALSTARDITERKQAEEEIRRLNAELEQRVAERTAQLEAANKELEAFAYSVSHDLRAPLRGIDGWSLALIEDYYDQLDEAARQYLNRVRGEAQRMGQLIDALLQLSRLTRAEIKKKPVDLTLLAQTIVTRLRAEQPERQVEVVIQPGLTAHGDPTQLEVVLTNLLGNAWKFTNGRDQARLEFGRLLPSPGGTTAGRTGGEDGAYFVRDNGVGFDMAYAQKLFGAFQRMHKTSQFPGAGIGLATVQRIIHRHGGRVWAEAQVDQGATFYFTLKDPKGLPDL
jgi:PAS domain S-box-containing protein